MLTERKFYTYAEYSELVSVSRSWDSQLLEAGGMFWVIVVRAYPVHPHLHWAWGQLGRACINVLVGISSCRQHRDTSGYNSMWLPDTSALSLL